MKIWKIGMMDIKFSMEKEYSIHNSVNSTLTYNYIKNYWTETDPLMK